MWWYMSSLVNEWEWMIIVKKNCQEHTDIGYTQLAPNQESQVQLFLIGHHDTDIFERSWLRLLQGSCIRSLITAYSWYWLPSVMYSFLHLMLKTSPNSTGERHFSLQTVSLLLSQGRTIWNPRRHRLHSLHITLEVCVQGDSSNSLSWHREQGRHALLRE